MSWEYIRVPWDRVNDMAAEGWRLAPVPPVAEMKNVLGQMQMGEPLFAMEREAAAGTARLADSSPPLLIQSPPSSGRLP